MKVFRFMNQQEFDEFQKGTKLKNDNKHIGYKTTSVGFCFLNLEDFEPEYVIHFLSGMVGLDICAVFETDEKNLNKGRAFYHKPYENEPTEWDFLSTLLGMDVIKPMMVTEYSTTEYSNEKFKIVKYAKPKLFDFTYEKWDWKEN